MDLSEPEGLAIVPRETLLPLLQSTVTLSLWSEPTFKDIRTTRNVTEFGCLRSRTSRYAVSVTEFGSLRGQVTRHEAVININDLESPSEAPFISVSTDFSA